MRGSYSNITDHLKVHDKKPAKVWIRKYQEKGVASIEDKRGDPHRAETEQGRELRRLYEEEDVLKKWLQNLESGVEAQG